MKRIACSVAVLALVVIALGVAVASTAQAAAPHCCATGAAAACRDACKQLSPGCRGSIGCRAGECVCTCNCTGDPI